MRILGTKSKFVFWRRLVPISLVFMYLWYDLFPFIIIVIIIIIIIIIIFITTETGKSKL